MSLGGRPPPTKKMDRLSRRKGREGGRKGGGGGERRILFGRRSTKRRKRICFARGQGKKKGGKQEGIGGAEISSHAPWAKGGGGRGEGREAVKWVNEHVHSFWDDMKFLLYV